MRIKSTGFSAQYLTLRTAAMGCQCCGGCGESRALWRQHRRVGHFGNHLTACEHLHSYHVTQQFLFSAHTNCSSANGNVNATCSPRECHSAVEVSKVLADARVGMDTGKCSVGEARHERSQPVCWCAVSLRGKFTGEKVG